MIRLGWRMGSLYLDKMEHDEVAHVWDLNDDGEMWGVRAARGTFWKDTSHQFYFLVVSHQRFNFSWDRFCLYAVHACMCPCPYHASIHDSFSNIFLFFFFFFCVYFLIYNNLARWYVHFIKVSLCLLRELRLSKS